MESAASGPSVATGRLSSATVAFGGGEPEQLPKLFV